MIHPPVVPVDGIRPGAAGKHPVYRIRAREVVPGMITQFGAVTVSEPRPDGMWSIHDDVAAPRYSFQIGPRDRIVSVTLPDGAPSPREMCCTCPVELPCGHEGGVTKNGWYCEICCGGNYLPDDSALEQVRLHACRAPSKHDACCPVAPVPGKHGGMKLWPDVGHNGVIAWEWDGERLWHGVRGGAAPPTLVCAGMLSLPVRGVTWTFPGYGDHVLQAFYHPPTSLEPLPRVAGRTDQRFGSARRWPPTGANSWDPE